MPATPSLPQHIRAADIMVRKLVTLTPDIDVFRGIDILVKNRISGAPVVDAESQLLGVFSEDSCMQVLLDAAYEQLPTTRVDAFMDSAPLTVTEETDLLTLAQTFKTSNRRRLPVVRGNQLVGQLSRRDVMKATLRLIDKSTSSETRFLYLSALRSAEDVSFT